MERAKRAKTPPKKTGNGKEFIPAKGAGHGKGFEPGHRKSVGNRGPEFKNLHRFITAIIRNKLLELDPRTQHMRAYELVDKLFELAVAGGEDGQPVLAAITAIMDRVEGKPVQAHELELSGPEKGPIVTAEASLEELADRYGEMIGAQSVNGRDD